MDDIYLVSNNVERLKEAVLALKDDLEKLNLKVNFSKCRTSRQVPGLEEIAVDKELKVLGVPLSVDADRGPLDKETGYLIEEIVKLEDTQAALLLLRNVHNTTPVFSLRTSSPATANNQSVCEGHPQQDIHLTCCNTELQGRTVE